jgi:aromatic-L-amino-acid decarboxylase
MNTHAGGGGDAARSLDPADWDEFARTSHDALDLMIGFLRGVADGPVWRQSPPDVLARFDAPLPHEGQDFAGVLDTFRSSILPYGTGNLHPLFMGWVHGAGTPYGMIAEMLAAGLNANCGGRNHIGIDVERQIARWAAEIFGYPADASGLFVTGTSMATFLGLLIARDAANGHQVRRNGLKADPQLVLYASSEAHGCVPQAADLAGIGSAHLRLVPIDAHGGMDVGALRDAIRSDRDAGHRPFLVVGTAGTVNTGAFDDLDAIADVSRNEGLWFHVDGALGALAILSPTLRPRLKGLERSQSIAFDFHKWAHVPYDAGFLMVRDPDLHRATFANPVPYLGRARRGLGSGGTWPRDLGPDLSRGFRALKTWMTIRTLGTDRIGAAIDRCCAVARHLQKLVLASDGFVPAAPVPLNIVCFGLRGRPEDGLLEAIVMDLQERGVAAPSMTVLGGKPVIRAAIVNHRTGERHMDLFVRELEASRQRLAGTAS